MKKEAAPKEETIENPHLVKIGNAELQLQSYKEGKCIFFGKHRCMVYDKTLREKQNALSKTRRCKGLNHVTCPFYRGASPFIPTYDESYLLPKKESEIIAYCLANGDNVLLYGPPATGKTSIIKQLAAILNWGVIQFSCSEETTSSKIFGQWLISNKEMKWADGFITTAMRHGFILLEDEADFMRPELRGEVHGVMEKEGTLTMAAIHPETGEPFQKVIPKHPSFRWVSTANTTGHGDDLFAFHGTQYINAATRDRYEVILNMEEREPEQELEILIRKTNIERQIGAKMIEVANKCRGEIGNGMIFQFSLRRLLALAKYWKVCPEKTACELTVLNYCNDIDRHTVASLFRTHLNLEAF